jgi:excisionase family DNA binding protein
MQHKERMIVLKSCRHKTEAIERGDTLITLVEQIRTTPAALTVPKLAKLLSMSPRSIYDHVERGTLPAFRIGTSVRLDPKVTANWLQERCTAA